MFCSICGSQIADGASFCPTCGSQTAIRHTDLSRTPMAAAAAPVQVNPRGLEFEPSPQPYTPQVASPQPAVAMAGGAVQQTMPSQGAVQPGYAAPLVDAGATRAPRRYDDMIYVNNPTKKVKNWVLMGAVMFALFAWMNYDSNKWSYGFVFGDVLTILLAIMAGGLAYVAYGMIPNETTYFMPQKSLGYFRMSNASHRKVTLCIGACSLVLLVALIWMFFFTDAKISFDMVLMLLGVVLTSYAAIKTIKIHQDVDYVTNDELAEIMDMTIDEKVMTSYQNFDTSIPLDAQLDDLDGNPNLFVMTQRQIFFAFHTQKGWISSRFKLENITAMDIDWDFIQYTARVRFQIQDGDRDRKLVMQMSSLDNLAQYPILIIRQMLLTLDAFKTGAYQQLSTKRKRRRSVSPDGSAPDVSAQPDATAERAAWEVAPEQVAEGGVRSLEFTKDVYDGLRNARQVISTRSIEL